MTRKTGVVGKSSEMGQRTLKWRGTLQVIHTPVTCWSHLWPLPQLASSKSWCCAALPYRCLLPAKTFLFFPLWTHTETSIMPKRLALHVETACIDRRMALTATDGKSPNEDADLWSHDWVWNADCGGRSDQVKFRSRRSVKGSAASINIKGPFLEPLPLWWCHDCASSTIIV